MAALLMASQSQGDFINPIYRMPPIPMMPVIKEQGSPESFGLYRANSRTHKAYLRKHHLGKFKKGRK